MFSNYFAARGGKANHPPHTAYDFAPWIKRPVDSPLKDKIRAGLRSVVKRG